MSRPLPTVSAALATLAPLLDGPRPPWCRAATWKALRDAVALARADLAPEVTPLPTAERWTAEERTEHVGASRSTVATWLRGWLRP